MKFFSTVLFAFFIVTLSACGGSSDGGSASATTETNTTALDENDTNTLNGTYAVTYFRVSDDFETIESSALDFFNGRLTIDIANDRTTSLIEMRDDELGIDYYDYDESSLGGSSGLTFDEFYAEQTGPYTLTLFYDTVCTEGVCADFLMRIRKTSDQVERLLSKPIDSEVEGSSNSAERLTHYLLFSHMYPVEN